MDKMFTPLTEQEKVTQTKPENGKDKGIAIIPIPHDVELIIPSHPLGTPHIVWDYRDKNGNLLFRTCRFIIPQNDGTVKKEDRPLSYRQYKNGQKRWAWARLDKPRPLYGLDRLAHKPEASVIICEGEKATDAATRLFLDHVAITSPNGAGSSGNPPIN